MSSDAANVEKQERPARTARVMIVEDERIVARSLGKQLTRFGYDVVGSVPSGTEALVQAENLLPDLVLMDIKLEGPIDGVQAATEIRHRFELPVIYLSANSNKETLDRAKIAQPYGYIIKPYEERGLYVTIETALYKSQCEREAMKSKNLEVERAIRVRDRFLQRMSHELRTPLNAIIGFTGTLLMELPGPLTPMQQDQLHTIENSAHHLLSLLVDLLDLAKIESGKVVLKLEPVALRSVLEDVVKTFQTLPGAGEVQLEVVAASPDAVVPADPLVATRILVHLVTSAIERTGKGCVRLEMGQREVIGRLLTEIKVTNSGISLDATEQTDAFESSSQTDDSNQQGSVIGLNLIRKLAQLTGAEITIQSERGKADTFTLAWSQDLAQEPGIERTGDNGHSSSNL